MLISDYSFHDAQIVEVRELTEQTLDFLLRYPVDCAANKFEPRILRFKDVYQYAINEIPFSGKITILEIKDMGNLKFSIGQNRNAINFERKSAEIITNAGTRVIHYSECDFFTP